MFVLALRADLRFPQSRSLKDKRRHLNPIVDGLRHRFTVSISETAHQNEWQRCEIGCALVSGDRAVIEKLADEVERFIWSGVGLEVVEIERCWLEIEH